jgi:serine/threonine-protein kinase
LPEFAKLTQADAQSKAEALKLGFVVAGTEFDEVVPEGAVIGWTVNGQTLDVGSEVPKGSELQVLISKGPAPRKVPKILNNSWEEAEAAIRSVDLVPVRLDDIFSDKWPAGIVASIDPGVGREVPRGSEVKIAISKGPDLVAVPNIYGSSQAKAEELLRAVDLQGVVEGPINRPVLAVDPAPGTMVKRGSTVKVRLG